MSDDQSTEEPIADAETPSRAADIRTLRLQKLDRLRAEGVTVYPYRFDRDRTLGELRAEFDEPRGRRGDRGRGARSPVA